MLGLAVVIGCFVATLAQRQDISLTDGQTVEILTPNYPNDPGTVIDQQWHLTSPSGTRIQLQCSEVVLYKLSGDCAEYGLHVESGGKKASFCGNMRPFEEESVDNEMRVRLEIGKWGVGRVKCRAAIAGSLQAEATTAHPLESEGPLTHIHVKHNQNPYLLRNPEFPQSSLENFPKWIITTDPGFRVGIYCYDVRFPGGHDCQKYQYGVKLTDGENGTVLCSNGGLIGGIGSQVSLTILKNMIWPNSGGVVACRVNSLKSDKSFEPYLGVESLEEDSSEDGVVPGKTGTTCKCGWANKNAERIIGGTTAKPNEYPFMAALLHKGSQNCGASVLTNTFALTAAHCTVKYETENLQVGFGISDLLIDTEWVQKIQVAEKIEHAEYKPQMSFANDIALLRLEKPIQFNEMVGPVCMPHNLPTNMNNRKLTTMGWGLIDQKNGILDTELQKSPAHTVDPVTCKTTSGGTLLDIEKPLKLCYYNSNSSATCNGDSGSPVVWVDPETNRYTQLSLVSYGQGGCQSLTPTVGTYVPNYMDWIQRYVTDGLCMKKN